jgi:hypothetical protein
MALALGNDDDDDNGGHLFLNEDGLLPLGSKNQCSSCSKTFSSKQKLEMHQIKYHPILLYKCPKCKESFVREDYLGSHILTHKMKGIEKPFKCQNKKCVKRNVGFPTKARLNQHMTRHEKKTIKCPDCNRLFKTNPELKAHSISKHSGKKPYACRIGDCKESFSSPGSRIWHEKNFDHPGSARMTCGRSPHHGGKAPMTSDQSSDHNGKATITSEQSSDHSAEAMTSGLCSDHSGEATMILERSSHHESPDDT